MHRVSLQTKILVLITTIILCVTLALTSFYAYFESKEVEENMGRLALRVATTVSLIPAIRQSFELEEPSTVIQPLAENIRETVGAEFVVVGNKESIRYAHPDKEKIGRKMVGDDNDRALLNGEFYTSKAVGTLGPSLRGKAPIFNNNGEVIGVVSVGFLIEDIRTIVLNKILKISSVALLILLFGILGGILLARNIRKDTLGLEPHQIAALYRERNAILLSIREGIIAIDNHKKITMVNHSAQKILGITDQCVNQSIEDVLPNSRMHEILDHGGSQKDVEVTIRDRVIIVNRIPIIEKGKVVGAVSSFRDKTELKQMVNTIFEIKKYSEEMRAQTHEFTNKLYVLSGLLQLGHYDEAVRMIQTERTQHETQNKILFEQINDATVQAILLGKISVASEKKVKFTVDENSSIAPLPQPIDPSQMITILGNLIDNAFEAVSKASKKEVSFFITDMGNDIVIEISDSGPGIHDIDAVFEQGYTTKDGQDRGYGLANLKRAVKELGGSIEIQTPKEGGTVFSVFLPKK